MKPITLHIDGIPYTVEGDGKNLLAICLSLGFDLPYFCWHPALHSVGACRQCAVKLFKDESDTRGRIVMSCMTPVVDGMRVSIDDPEARASRAGIVEDLMVNHPHDCPICDEGGECHLQDMTIMTGHVVRRYRFTKRTHRNQDLGPFLKHEMNRCIQCYRCVRFYRDYAGGRDLQVLGWHDNVYFGRHADGPLENEFSGNLVEVCPTGVFTDKTLSAHYTRKWDLQTAPSICVHCAVGCNTIPGERLGLLRRIRSRYNGAVNGYFLCDRGRYGYEFVNSASRVRAPLVREGGDLREAGREEALARAASILAGGPAIGIGSPRASLESNFALRELVGSGSFFAAVSDADLALWQLMVRSLSQGPAPSASVADAGVADAVLVLGEDVWNTAPILALALRQAAFNRPFARAMAAKRISRWDDVALRRAAAAERGPFFVATAEPTPLDEVAAESIRVAPDDAARLGYEVAHRIDPGAPAVAALSAREQQRAATIADALLAAARPVIVSGCGLRSAAVIRAATNVARALKAAGRDARLALVFPHAGSFGIALLASGGLESAARAFEAVGAQSVVVAEADLHRVPNHRLPRAPVRLIAIDHTRTRTTDEADVVLPAATFAESTGTLVSSEGRAQRSFAVSAPAAPVQETWRWVADLAEASGRRRPWATLDQVIDTMGASMPLLRPVRDAAPGAAFRVHGMRIPRKSLRESGRTAVNSHLDMHEPRPPADPDSPFAYSIEGFAGQPPSPLIARLWAPGWNSDQAVNKFQIEVGGPLHGGDPGVRLVEPPAGSEHRYLDDVPPAFVADDALLVVPAHRVFGSEELSSLSQPIVQRTTAPFLALSPSDSERLGLAEGATARVSLGGADLVLAVTVRDLPRGVAAIPAGLSSLPALDLPARARVSGGSR